MIANECDVNVWVESLIRSPREVARLWDVLSSAERDRSSQFVFLEHRRQFIVGRGLLRLILGVELAEDPRDVSFTSGPYGKPELAEHVRRVSFNLAHSKDLVAYAVTKRPAVGIDIEYMRDIDTAAIARTFFSRSERAQLERVPLELRRGVFYAGWVRKEAFMKALGTGLSLPSDRFDVSISPGTPARIERHPPGVETDWQVHDFAPGEGYCGAVATAGPPPRVQIHTHAWRV